MMRTLTIRKGFTLVELMIVMLILGVLVALLLPNFLRARFKAFHSACMTNEKNIATALESYAADNSGLYPTALVDLSTGALEQRYIAVLPTCPSSGVDYTTGYTYDITNPDDGYTVACPGIHSFQLDYVRPNYPLIHNGNMTER